MIKYLELEPARAKSKKPDDLWGSPLWIAEEKLDGWRFLSHFGGGLDRCYMTGRRVSSRTGLLSEKGLCAPCLWPSQTSLGYTVVDGEVLAPTGFRDVAGIMNVSPEDSAKRIAQIGPPRYHVFDALFVDGRDVRGETLQRRCVLLEEIFHEIYGANEQVELVAQVEASLETYDKIVERGGEGVILKDVSSTYGESGGWVKVKKYSTLDVIVTGFTDARFGRTGKYDGLIGAARVSVYASDGQTLIEVGKVSGMDDDTRVDMSTRPDRWLGCVIEVAAQEFGKDRLRHPRYRRRREDADPRAATFGKMLADLRQADAPPGGQLRLL